ncbi:hypothetical protein Tco_0951083 [Tanacetum coccineum]|uniref:Uncharacterized protein n=1 Tax=Tanacetum coccineum TaxID=301880 RepID=A0ABQ5CR09_9ASTR
MTFENTDEVVENTLRTPKFGSKSWVIDAKEVEDVLTHPEGKCSSLTLSPFHDNPYMKVMQAYDAIPPPQAIIALPAVLPPSPVLLLSPMFDSRYFLFLPEEDLHQLKQRDSLLDSTLFSTLSSSVGFS